LRCREGQGLTRVGLSVVACFGRKRMSVRGSFGGCGGRLGVRGGAWRRWETHQRRGGPGRWMDEEVVDEVAVEEVAGSTGFGALRRLLTGRWLGVGAALGDPTRSCKADGEVARHVVDSGARWQLWWPLKSRASGGEREEEEKELASTCSGR
jgi:hypothetical protein